MKTPRILEWFAELWDAYPRWLQGMFMMLMIFNGIHIAIADIGKLIDWISK